ncbi:MAG TPA: HlyD family type I secretion periplasmic adaptor subunit [Stellaceae bacterium]|jgi:HlyD family secretion protein|nr:HlyD family type I secretion periplasmic adaptor subunit [Stellaceae bacterium]
MRSFRSGQQLNDGSADTDKVIRLFQSETSEIAESPEPAGVRATVYVLGAFLVALIVTSLVTRLDRVVTSSSAEVVTVQPTVVLQALDPSIIKTLDVREGQRVKAGDVLATLDPTFATADVDALKIQIAGLNAQIARCEAELAGRPYNPAPTADPGASQYNQLQRSYYLQRKAQYDAQIHSYDEQIGQVTATIAKMRNDESRYSDRAKLAKEVEQMRATLAAAQVGSRLNLLAATDQKTELLRNVEYNHNSLIESQHQLEATTATRNAFAEQWLGQTSQELVTARNQRDAALQQLDKASKHKDLVRLVATEDSVVLKMAQLSVGSVLKEGDPLIYLAPMRSPVEVEAKMLPRDVGFIRAGDPVKIKFDAFNYIEHGMADGTVRWISEGAFTTDDNGTPANQPYYKVRIALTKVDLHNLPEGFRLIPGMTLTADVHIGTRSLLMYIVSGAVRGANEAMREP